MSRIYSLENLREIAGGDEEFMETVAQTFLDEIPPDLEAMTQAIQNGNKELAYQFAHKMKPNLEMLGLNLTKEITAIESWTNTSKNKAAIESQLQKVNSTLKQAFKELRADFNL